MKILSKKLRGSGHSLEGVAGRAGSWNPPEVWGSRVLREGRWLGGLPGSGLAPGGMVEPIPGHFRRRGRELLAGLITVVSLYGRLRRAEIKDGGEGRKVVSMFFWFSFVFWWWTGETRENLGAWQRGEVRRETQRGCAGGFGWLEAAARGWEEAPQLAGGAVSERSR